MDMYKGGMLVLLISTLLEDVFHCFLKEYWKSLVYQEQLELERLLRAYNILAPFLKLRRIFVSLRHVFDQ